jgi:hypothetical protein
MKIPVMLASHEKNTENTRIPKLLEKPRRRISRH